MVEQFRVVPAAYVILRRSDEVLLQLRQNTGYRDGYWAAAAAGHVEAAESVFAAAAREAHEELGIDIAAGDLEPLCAMHRTYGNGRPIDERVDWFFQCRRWVGEPQIMETDKAADLRWFRVDALPEDVVPHERAVLDRLRDETMVPILSHGFGDVHQASD